MSTTRTTPPFAGPASLPSLSRMRNVPIEELEALLATDDDLVDTAVIPALDFRKAVERAAAVGTPSTATPAARPAAKRPAMPPADDGANVETTEVPALDDVEPESATQPARPPFAHSLRSRHATPESKAAVRRNLIAVCCVVVSLVVVGVAVGLTGGWIVLGCYTLLVVVAAFVLHRINARYTPRHSRYTPLHA